MRNNHSTEAAITNKNGFTLIELIVTVAIVSIVIGSAFSFQLFNTTIMNKGIDQFDVQSQLRQTTDFIVSDVRNATEIVVSNIPPASPETYSRIYINSNKIMWAPPGGTAVNKTDAIIANSSDVDFSLSYDATAKKYSVNCTIIGTSGTNTYSVSTVVLLNNIQPGNATVTSDKQAIYYKKGTALVAGGTPPPPPPTPPGPPSPPGGGSGNNKIASVSVKGGGLTAPTSFSPDVEYYKVAKNTTIDVTPSDSKAKILPSKSQKVTNGKSVTFTVVAENGEKKTYTFENR